MSYLGDSTTRSALLHAFHAGGETQWQGRRLVIAHDDERAARQSATRRKKIAALEEEGDRLASRLDKTLAGCAPRGRKSTDALIRVLRRWLKMQASAGS